MQDDEIRVRKIRMVSIDLCFLIVTIQETACWRLQYIKLIELQEASTVWVSVNALWAKIK